MPGCENSRQGFATTLAAHLICHSAIALPGYNTVDFWTADENKTLAARVRACVVMHGTYRPAKTLEEQVFMAISSKKQAALRQPPNLLQLAFAFGRIVDNKKRTSRKSAPEILNDIVKAHQKAESVVRARLLTDEIRGLKILARQTERFKHRLAAIWGSDKFQYTAVPLDLIASNFLDPTAELPVDKKTNPVWANILQKSDEKMEMWLLRVSGKFECELDSRLSGGRNVCMANQAHLLRDPVQERPVVFRMACMWVDALPEVFHVGIPADATSSNCCSRLLPNPTKPFETVGCVCDVFANWIPGCPGVAKMLGIPVYCPDQKAELRRAFPELPGSIRQGPP